MKVTKNKDHYLFQNELGEYHLSIEKYKVLGRKAAIKLAESEIKKKNNSEFKDLTIDFNKARNLGFCEYGIKDFCSKLNLNINNTYEISYLRNKLTVEVLVKYSNECFKLFGKNVLDKFGGPKELLSKNRNRDCLNLILNSGFISDNNLGLLACEFATRVLPIFESKYPEDKRPRQAIEAKLLYLQGKISSEKLEKFRVEAWAAVIEKRPVAVFEKRSVLEIPGAAMAAAAVAEMVAVEVTTGTRARAIAEATSKVVEGGAWRAAGSTELNWQIDRVLDVI